MGLTQKGNSKLKKAGMLMFNLPAGMLTCGMECPGCYAIREQKRFKSVENSRVWRHGESLRKDFVERVNFELRYQTRPKYFRVHASGDFYSQEYVNKWVQIAKDNPDITFYAYTKRYKSFDFSELRAQDNFILINSSQYKKLNYGKLEDAPKGAFICPDQPGADVSCGIDCNYCMTKQAEQSPPYFRKH